MKTVKKIFRSDHAKTYDRKAEAANWLDPAIVFGLAYRFVNPGERLLDVGIGTGLSSELFYKAGLKIYGVDFSPEMLSCCRSKQMAVELEEHDLSHTPYPFDPNTMDHAVCTGVTHLFEDMGPIFQELSRILRPGGTFSFVVADCVDDESRTRKATSRHHPGAREVTIYCYSEAHIRKLLEDHHFKRISCLKFRASSIGNEPGTYRAYVVQKISGDAACQDQN
jgi:ubiquinone/menaquinone biosynthesis C-methylase UbiE